MNKLTKTLWGLTFLGAGLVVFFTSRQETTAATLTALGYCLAFIFLNLAYFIFYKKTGFLLDTTILFFGLSPIFYYFLKQDLVSFSVLLSSFYVLILALDCLFAILRQS